MGCLDDDAVLRLIHGQVAGAELAAADAHLDDCASCRELVGVAARGSDGRDAPGTDELRRGDPVGRYVVLGRLGGGAMGVVYAAHDAELDRKVALKLLRPELGGGGDRLLREAQAMARLQHPNVVTVHDVGALGDDVFVAMELVDGPTLRTWATGRSWRERLDVVRAVGRGLAAAHAAGVTHRDVKPDNVIVGDDGRPRIGDFGLARAGADARLPPSDVALSHTLTRTGTVLGTPAYMAPEQLRGEPATPASDQFGLAVTCWEIVYGARPFGGRDLAGLAAAIERGPEAPSTTGLPSGLDRAVRRALGRALSPDPARRFPSVAALIDALDWAPRRVWRWGAPAAVASAAVAVVLIAARPGAAADPCARVGAELDAAWSASVQARVGQRLAAAGDTVSAERLAAWGRRWTAARVEVCRATRVRGAQSPALLDVRQGCLERGRAELAALVAELDRADPAALTRVVDAVDALTDPDECAASPALALLAPVAASQREAVAAVEAQAARLRARLITAAPVDPEDGAALVATAAATGHAPTVAAAQLVHAELLRRAGRYRDADRAARDAIVAAETGHDDLGSARAWIARLGAAGDRRDLVAADEWIELAGAALARAGDPPALVARLANSAGLLAMNRGELDRAQDQLDRALAVRRALAGDHADRDVDVARTLSALGHVARLRERFDDALARHREALAIDRAALGPDHPDVGRDLHNLAGVLRRVGRLDQAGARYREALAVRRRALGDDHPEVGLTHNSLALVAMERGDLAVAAAQLAEARRILSAADHGDLAMVLANLGQLALRRDDPRGALELLTDAAARYRAQLPPRHEYLAAALLDATRAAAGAGQRVRAVQLLAEAHAAIPDGPAAAALLDDAAALAAALAPIRRPPRPPPAAPAPAPAPTATPAPTGRPVGTYGSAQGWD